ncbi:MAG: glycosyltransferase [Cytophagales bacterium]|nr:glycosyltransferase [Cytophaga sp.]
MYEKIGKSLALLPNTEIHIAGYEAAVSLASNEFFYPIFSSSRLSFKRLLASWKFLIIAVKVKPDTIIVSTHELLIVTYLYKILFGCAFIYDVQENYLNNLLYTDTFPPLIKHILGHWVRSKERFCSKKLDGYILAEKTYATELKNVIHPPYLTLENKYNGLVTCEAKIVTIREGGKIKMLYSGTIAASYGIFEAIDLAIRLYLLDYRFELTIIGYAPSSRDLDKVKNRIAPYPFIELIGGNKPVPHSEILSAIKKHHIGLLPYRFNESTHLRVPTKLFEYFLNHLPVISSYNPIWEEYISKYNAGITIHFNNLPLATEIKEQILNKDFYSKGNPKDLIWEEEKLRNWYQTEFM